MPQPLAVAAVGGWHVHAADYAREACEHPDTTLVAFWDDDIARGQELAHRFGVPFVPDLAALLNRDDLDGITVTTATSAHLDVVLRAIAAGKHVFTEKHLATTSEDTETLIAASEQAGVALVVSLPRLTHGYTLTLDRMLTDGALGDLLSTRIRLGHDGWRRGWLPDRFDDAATAVGGALFDLGAHPVYLTYHLHGAEATAVSGSFVRPLGRQLDEIAVAVGTFPGERIGVMESSLSEGRSEFFLEVRGSEAMARYSDVDRTLRVWRAGAATTEGEVVELLPDGPTPFDAWVEHIRTGTAATCNLDHARVLTRMTLAAYRADTDPSH